MEKGRVKIEKRGLLLTLFLFLTIFKPVFAQNLQIPKDILIAAIVQPWLYFEVSPLDLTLSPDLVSIEGRFNIGESPEVIFKVGTSNPGGWEIKIKGKNNGLKSSATGYIISTVNGTSSLSAGNNGYGLQATTTLAGVIINPIYNYFDTSVVGEIVSDYRVLATKYSSNLTLEVVKIKIKAAASIMAPADVEYTDFIISTVIPLI